MSRKQAKRAMASTLAGLDHADYCWSNMIPLDSCTPNSCNCPVRDQFAIEFDKYKQEMNAKEQSS